MSFLLAAVGAIGTLLLSDKAEYDKGKESETLLLEMFATIVRMNIENDESPCGLVQRANVPESTYTVMNAEPNS